MPDSAQSTVASHSDSPISVPQGDAPGGDDLGGDLAATLRLYARTLFHVAGGPVILAVAVTFLVSLTEGIGIALLLPLLQVAGFRLDQGGPLSHYAAACQRMLLATGVPQPFWLALLLMIFMVLVAMRSLLNRAQSVLTFAAVLRFDLQLTRRLYSAILNANWLYLSRRRSSDFTHALTGEIARVDMATFGLVTFGSNAIASLFYIALAMKISVTMTMLVLGSGALLALLTRGHTRAAHQSGQAISRNMQDLYAAATEHLQNLKTVKALASQQSDLAMFSALQQRVSAEVIRNTRIQAATSFWFEIGSLLVLGLVILCSLQWLGVAPAAILLLLVVFTRLMPRLSSAYSQYQSFISEIPAFRNVKELEAGCLAAAETIPGPENPPELHEAVRLDDVSFGYLQDGRRVLDHVSLRAQAGRVTAILGASGAGKSTAADLINGLLTPDSGRVMVDGTELTPALARSWRNRVGYVAQDTVLFHDTVRANLRWAKPDATEEEMLFVLRQAAADFVLEMPHGLDSIVGDRGVLLSNGQRQRIALARALLRKPSLLILDEATNSLDLESEKRILDSIHAAVSASLRGQREPLSVIIIAHRFSAVERADMVYILEGGRVTASGSWEIIHARQGQRTPIGIDVGDEIGD
ncbi:MAG TPA: ABC transporter ATP-binding protein [Acidisarcina sp.]|nr:ABC transporter ATP-binding protein [Acidisarcina sp.]